MVLTMVFSDLQASEVDILQSILRWGEHQLMKRIEDRGKSQGLTQFLYRNF